MIDNIVDIATLVVGLSAAMSRPALSFIRRKKIILSRRRILSDFLNGAVIVPYLVMISAPLSGRDFGEMINDSRLSFAVAGAVALMLIGNEFVSDE